MSSIPRVRIMLVSLLITAQSYVFPSRGSCSWCIYHGACVVQAIPVWCWRCLCAHLPASLHNVPERGKLDLKKILQVFLPKTWGGILMGCSILLQ